MSDRLDASSHPADDTFVAWVSGELTGAAALALENHVAGCPHCAVRLQQEAALEVVLGAAGVVEPDAVDEEDSVVRLEPVARIEVSLPPRRRVWTTLQRYGFGVAAALALVIGGRTLLQDAAVDTVVADLGADPMSLTSASLDLDDEDAAGEGPCCEEVETFEESEPVPWTPASGDPILVSMAASDDEPCAPFDTGASLVCEDDLDWRDVVTEAG